MIGGPETTAATANSGPHSRPPALPVIFVAAGE
jgi:hypothetical protein